MFTILGGILSYPVALWIFSLYSNLLRYMYTISTCLNRFLRHMLSCCCCYHGGLSWWAQSLMGKYISTNCKSYEVIKLFQSDILHTSLIIAFSCTSRKFHSNNYIFIFCINVNNLDDCLKAVYYVICFSNVWRMHRNIILKRIILKTFPFCPIWLNF